MDVNYPTEIPDGCTFVLGDVLEIKQVRGIFSNIGFDSSSEPLHNTKTTHWDYWRGEPFDLIVASSPCEEFSVHGMKHFHPKPKYPRLGIRLFNHTRELCEASGVPYVMENVRAAQEFVGSAAGHCGPFYLWGTAVPVILPKGVNKGTTAQMAFGANGKRIVEGPRKYSSGSKGRANEKAKRATIPPELANCVADYAEALLRDGGRLRRGA